MKARKTSKTANYRVRPDVERIGEAISRPGIDPRTWVATARVDNDPDAFYFDEDVGWIIDATVNGGSIHGSLVACRQGSTWPGVSGYGSYLPPDKDEELLVVFPGGDPEEDPIVLGTLTNGDGGKPPTSICGRSVVATGTTSPGGDIAAPDCEFSKSPYSVVREWDGELHYQAKQITLKSKSKAEIKADKSALVSSPDTTIESTTAPLKLGTATAISPVTRADMLAQALGIFADSVAATFAADPMLPQPNLATFQAAVVALKLALQTTVPSPTVVVP